VSDKDKALNDADVLAARKEVEAELADNGRVLLRKSGTEPLIRVMVEAETDAKAKEMAKKIADAVEKCK